MDKVTVYIIIPVYNKERYLHKCLNSVRKQTYRNIAVLLIDDGSKDKSLQICEKYAKEDSRFKVFHQENSGAASARNVGLEYAINHPGEHIMFVDADDWLPKNAVEALVRKQQETGADWVFGNRINVIPLRNVNVTAFTDSDFGKKDTKKYFELFSTASRFTSPCAKLYQKKIMFNNNLRFNEEQKAAEDGLFNFQYVQHCENFTTVPEVVYCCNRLITCSLSTTFIPERNQYYLNNLLERHKCFDYKLSPSESFAESDCVFDAFNSLIRSYVRQLPKPEAVKWIRETHELFAELLNDVVFKDVPQDKYPATKKYSEYEPFLKVGQYDKVYDYFYTHEIFDDSLCTKAKCAIKNIMGRIRLFILFGR